MEVSDRIKQIRAECGLTQEEIARKLGIAKRTWEDYEAGKTLPKAATLRKMAELGGVSTDWVLKGGPRHIDVKLADQVKVRCELTDIGATLVTLLAHFLMEHPETASRLRAKLVRLLADEEERLSQGGYEVRSYEIQEPQEPAGPEGKPEKEE